MALLSGVGHWIAVTMVAFGERGGFDARLARLLAIGFLPVGCGAVMLYGAWRVGADTAVGLGIASLASGIMAATLIALWQSLSTGPNGSAIGTGIGIALFAAESVAAWFVR